MDTILADYKLLNTTIYEVEIQSRVYFHHFVENNAVSLVLLVATLGLTYFFRNGKKGSTLRQENNRDTFEKTFPRYFHFPRGLRIPILEGLYSLHRFQKDGIHAASDWASKFKGNLGFQIYLGPVSVFAVTNPSLCQKIMNSAEPGHLSKPKQIYDRLLIDWLSKGILNSDYELWVTQRKVLSRAFTYRALHSYLEIMNKRGKEMIEGLKTLSNSFQESGGCVSGNDLYDTLKLCLVRIISDVTFGPGCSSKEDSARFVKNFYIFKDAIVYRFLHPYLFISPLWWLHPKRREMSKSLAEIHDFIMKIIKVHENKLGGRRGKLNDIEDEGEEKDIFSGDTTQDTKCLIETMLYYDASQEEVNREVLTFLVVGQESTTSAMKCLLFDLALNLEYQAKCREEVDLLFKSKSSNFEQDIDLNMDDMANLKYVERCILESLRMSPTVPFFLRRLDKSLEVNENLTIEAGNIAAFVPWLLHKDPRYYPNPEVFDPDRFLPENVKAREPYTFISFSGGTRNCLGWKFSIIQMKVTIAWLLRNFEISTTDRREDVKLLFDVTIKPERNFNIILTRRREILN